MTAPGPVQGHLAQARRAMAITLLGSGSIQISGVGFIPGFRLDTPDNPWAGAFTCNDPDLNKIWQIGVHTVNACAYVQGTYMDILAANTFATALCPFITPRP